MRTGLAAVVAVAATLIGGFVAAALPATFVLVGGAGEDGTRDRRIFLAVTPVHADIVVPIADDVADWRPLLSSGAFPGGRADHDLLTDLSTHIAIGWGARSFYFNVKRLADLRPRFLGDALWDDGVIHVTALRHPDGAPGLIPLSVSEAGYRRLVAALGAAFVQDGGRPVPIVGESHHRADGFFAARADYSMLRSCNVWAAERLREAGLAMPLWSPFAFGVARAARLASP